MSVKYGGEHVKNSPFTVRVSGAPDPEKVKVYGPGVEHGVLGMNQTGEEIINQDSVHQFIAILLLMANCSHMQQHCSQFIYQ